MKSIMKVESANGFSSLPATVHLRVLQSVAFESGSGGTCTLQDLLAMTGLTLRARHRGGDAAPLLPAFCCCFLLQE